VESRCIGFALGLCCHSGCNLNADHHLRRCYIRDAGNRIDRRSRGCAMTDIRPSDRAIAQAFWELVESQLFLPNPQMDAVLTMIDRDARTIDATAAPVVVGEDMVSRAMHAYMDAEIDAFGEVRTPNNGARREAMRKALTAALAGD
jgi:hypothetical protein